ncbi:MAG: WecB/TagA/CpsF family glycosyltransferase [Spirochaetota bacterium]
MLEPQNIEHSSSKEEKDYLFDYRDISVDSLPTQNFYGVPFSLLSRDEAIAHIFHFVETKEKVRHILFLDPLKFMLMRKGKQLNRIAQKASMVLHNGAGIHWAAKNHKIDLKERFSIISLMMDLFRYSEKNHTTIYFLGGKEDILEKTYYILTRRFPELRIVGRQAGYLSKTREVMVKEAIRKTEPDIIFVAMDFLEQEKWIENNMQYFGSSVVIGISGTLDVLAGVTKAPSYLQSRGLTWLWRTLTRPWNLHKMWILSRFYSKFLIPKNK